MEGQKTPVLVNTALTSRHVNTVTHPAPQAAIALATDASDMTVCAVLEQRAVGIWQPLAFALVANYVTMHHLWFLLEGCSFAACINHKPWIFAISKVTESSSARQQRFPVAISEIMTDTQQVVANANAASCWLQVRPLKLRVLIWNLLFFLKFTCLQLWMRGS